MQLTLLHSVQGLFPNKVLTECVPLTIPTEGITNLRKHVKKKGGAPMLVTVC